MLLIPEDIGVEVGYKASSNMIRKINAGKARPSPKKCRAIIKACLKRGIRITLSDLRPDLKDLIMDMIT